MGVSKLLHATITNSVKDPNDLTGQQWLILNAFDGVLKGSKSILQEALGLYWEPWSHFIWMVPYRCSTDT